MKHEAPDKIIFLDIDGVINIPDFTKFDTGCMSALEEIIKATGAKIVVSSSWRTEHKAMMSSFKEHGMTDVICDAIIGITCRGYHYVKPGSNLPIVRGIEIKHWIDTNLRYPWQGNPELTKLYNIPDEVKDGQTYIKGMEHNSLNKDFSYIILDDDSDMLYDQKDNFLLLDPYEGLTQQYVGKAVAILNYKERAVALPQ